MFEEYILLYLVIYVQKFILSPWEILPIINELNSGAYHNQLFMKVVYLLLIVLLISIV